MSEGKDNRLSFLRAVACIAIVVLHTTYIANITFTDSYGMTGNILSNEARNLMLFAVPNFVMVTGALLLNPAKEISIKKLFTKYIRRVFLALLIFCVIYQVFDSWLIDGDLGIGSIIQGVKEAITGGSWSTMWYPYLLIGIYLLLPFYRMVSEKASESQLRYLLLVYLVFMFLIPILGLWGIKSGFYINVSTIYPFYLFFGYGIYSGKLKISRNLGWVMAILGSVATVLLTWLRWTTDNQALEAFRDYNAINVVIQSCGIFTGIFGEGSSVGKGEGLLTRIALNLDENSFGIYLIHIVIIKWLFRVVKFDPYLNNAIITFIIAIVGILSVSWLITFIIRKIPGVKTVL